MMILEKEKRKEQPINLKRYWLIFGLLAIVLLIPFRLIGYWQIVVLIYALTGFVIGIVLMRFVMSCGWKHWVIILMLGTMLLPIFQATQTYRHARDCWVIIDEVLLQYGVCVAYIPFGYQCRIILRVPRNTIIGVQTHLLPCLDNNQP